jgi:amino acid permease
MRRRALIRPQAFTVREHIVLITILASILGAAGAIVYVGFFAIKVGAPPLIIIVIGCLLPMVYAFYDDIRQDREMARIRSEQKRK